ncbi:metallophosphoesterase [Eubacteriales bacterium KG127]
MSPIRNGRAILADNKNLYVSRYDINLGVGMRIVHLSDIQGAGFGTDNSDLIERVALCNPDLIAITGDLIDRRMKGMTDFKNSIELCRKLANISSIVFSYGNHELAFSPKVVNELKLALEAVGVIVLKGESHLFDYQGKTIKISGFDEILLMVPGKNRMKKNFDVNLEAVLEHAKYLGNGYSLKKDVWKKEALCSANPWDASILLAHEPQFIREYGEGDFDLILSGHAHGGQIRLPLIGGVFAPGQGFFPKYTAGIHRAGAHSRMVISRGLGNSTFPIRIGNPPEIVVIET